MKLSKVIMLVVLLGVLAMAMHVSIDSDSWWHLRAGQWMVEHRQPITEDVFSYTSVGKPWQYPGLWVQVMMYKLYDWFGPGGLNLWVSLMVAAIFGIVWQTTQGNELLRAVVVVLAAIASAIYWAARPYLLTYLLFAIFFYLLERHHRAGKGGIWMLPLLMIVWVNSHGGFLAGFILWGPYFVDAIVSWIIAKRHNKVDEVRNLQRNWLSLLWVGLVMLVASLINPQGVELWSLPFTTVSRQAEQLFIAEWQSPDFHNPTLMPFAWMLVLSIVILGAARKKLALYEILLMAGFGLLGLISVRNIFFFVIIAPAVLTRVGGEVFSDIAMAIRIDLQLDFSKRPTRIGGTINLILVIIVGIVAFLRVVSYLPESINQDTFKEEFPVSAVEFLQENELKGRMFNSYNYGGYLIWTLPDYPVYVDGRADLHQDEIILTWYRTINGSDEWVEVFEKWDIGFVLVEPGVPLLSELEDAGWKAIFEDEVSVIAVPLSGEVLED